MFPFKCQLLYRSRVKSLHGDGADFHLELSVKNSMKLERSRTVSTFYWFRNSDRVV